ncbi:MAG TPA: YCF48-related protein [Gemmataceae bacterium]|nr:YCF48-related protein [Gemmataceae bacterium]
MRSIHTLSISLTVLAMALCPFVRGAELRNFEDAALHAVQFWDNREGWAVGDEGVIWHTIDGGKHWERQPSGVRASLRSLHFLDPYTGWIVGREELPNGTGSTGVVLYTKDGGLNWQRVMLNMMPGLNRVRFVDAASGYKVGYLVGDGNDAHPSGVFQTTDCGRTWQTLTGARSTSWLAAAFGDNGEGALAGAWNRLATVRKDRVYQVSMDALGGRALCDLQLRGDDGLAVGQGGLILRSDKTRGSSWDYVKLKLPREVRDAWDFHAVHGVGSHYWVVGRPGSMALHSSDRGRKWDVVPTGQPLPLHGIFFTDEQHGWAVGEFGTITATTDGGKTWKAQHRGGQRAAVLFLHARAGGIPLDTVAKLGGEDGYLCAALRVTASDLTTAAPARSVEGARFAAAMRESGGAAGEMLWAFPLSSHLRRAPRADLLHAWDTVHEGHAADQMLRQLVLTIRMWRPAVIITDSGEEKANGFACDPVLAEAVRAAFERASDPRTFPEQLTGLGLEPWQVAKVYAVGQKSTSRVALDLTAIAPRLQSTLREFASGPAALLAGESVLLPDQRDFALLAAHGKGAAGHRDLMQGVDLAPGGLARRMLGEAVELPAELLKAIHQRTNLKALSETPASALTDPNRLLGQMGPMLAEMPDDQAAPAAYAIANQYARMGQWSMAREAFLLLIDRYPAHPLAMEGYRWLIRHNSSTEARHRHELGQFVIVESVQHGMPVKEGSTLGKPGEADASIPGIKLAGWNKDMREAPEIPRLKSKENSQTYLFAKKDQIRQWYQSSLDLEPKLAGFGPLLASDPALQFCLQASRRNLGDFQTPHKWYTQFAARQPDGPWRAAALAELWLTNRTGAPPKPVLPCRYTETRPLLDGKLNESCWQVAPIKLQNATSEARKDAATEGRGSAGKDAFLNEFPTEVRMAYDKEFLYLSLKCTHPTGRFVSPVKPRSRDADLRGHDRVSVLLDLDRDYSTCFHLQIDQRGCVCEDCWGDKKWDPRWFVSMHSDATCWVIEAAIPLLALTGDSVTTGKAWACNVVRVVPGRGVQAWSLPAEVPEETLRPEGMGLLMFAHDQPADEPASPTR